MEQTVEKSKWRFGLYRLSTILKSFKVLYSLPPEKVDAFLSSYEIYDHDWANEEQLIRTMGIDYYQKIKQKLVDWYSVLNHLCAIGQVEKMYIPPAMDLSVSIIANQALFEKKMCRDLALKKGDKVLDIGCGRGRVASHVASLTGAHVIGMNIDQDQLDSARYYALQKGLFDRCQFQHGDLNDIPLPFPGGSLDAVYHIQVFSLSKNLLKLFQDIHRVLKPGGRLSCLDWVSLKNYNPKNPHHLELMRRIKPLIGAIGTFSVEEYAHLLKKAGFEILVDENPSIDGLQAPLIDKVDRFFTRLTRFAKLLIRLKILPKHFGLLLDRLTQDGQAFVEADRLRLVTTTHHFVAQKKK